MAGLFRTFGVRFVWRCVMAVILAGSSLSGPVWAQEEDKISQEQLRSELQRFALQFESQMGEAVDILLASTTDPQRRRQLREARAFYLTDLLQMATGPIPEVNLLDMVVYTTLNRIVTEEDIVPNVLGESGERALDTLLRLEQDIWSLAARALSVEQQRELRGEIFDWRERNTDISYITGVRIGDFSEQFAESSLLRTARRGFLLPEVNAATAAIDEVRLLAERMFFFTQSLAPIMRAFTELTYVGVLAEP